ncbi:hypothetical protein OSB04_029703 [Centaurea solstitialis]|uniref:Reverse transcriptase domain-containing protein n=1 Tax=Centaurea solstitialis TaxID=347529 RepID=A0AA38S668_9ASTR|nr:hypothetical protein OSB04_029703 [Centaurea solstitialis]
MFREEEIRNAVWNIGGEKAPGPDGLTFAFLRKYWDIVGTDFYRAIKEFESYPNRIAVSNSSFIALIPKAKDPLCLDDFRPIHLLGCVTKAISKMLAERLKSVIGDVISPVQSAFVKGRQILDGPLIVNEILSWAKRLKKRCYIFKVDFAKAFDNVNWEFLWEVMGQMNFGQRWISWLKGLICTAQVSILVNGSPTKQFKVEKGINWNKSTINGIGVTMAETERLAGIIGCKAGTIPFRYLGLPIGADMRKKDSWKPLIEKFEQKLSMWKMKLLSIGGRLCLCKAVLGAVGVFLFSMYRAPKGILKILEKLRRNFFWGSSDRRPKIAWVAWDLVLNSKDKGGLGIGSLRAMNIALLSKWWWRFKTEKNALWRKVIIALHGAYAKLGGARNALSSKGTWGAIAAINKDLEDLNIPLQNLFQRQLGDGSDVSFWNESWCCQETFADRWPRLVALEANPNCSVADRCERSSNGVIFHGQWRREIRDGREALEVRELEDACKNVQLGSGDSKWSWALCRSGYFNVSSLRKAVDEGTLRGFNHVTSWNKNIPSKVRIFSWKTRLDRLPTLDNLLKRDLFVWMDANNQPSEERSRREVIGNAYLWGLWIDRNNSIFNNKEFNSIRTANSILSLMSLWLRSRVGCRSLSSWLDRSGFFPLSGTTVGSHSCKKIERTSVANPGSAGSG